MTTTPRVQIGRFQLFTLFANLVFGKAIGYTNEVLTRAVGNDAWVSLILAFLTGMAVMIPVVWLAGRFRTEVPDMYITRLAGRIPGSVLLLLAAVFFFGSFATSAVTIEQHINDYLMAETPLIIFVIGYTLLCMYGAYLGLEVTARLSVLGLILTALLTFLMVIGSFDQLDLRRMLPVMDHSPLQVLGASIAAGTDVSIPVMAALFLLPLTDKVKGWLKLSWWGLAVACLLVLTWTIFELGVLGPEVTAQYLIACMQMARAAELSIYLHRYELIMVILFVYGVVAQSIICLYCACELTRAALPGKLSRGWVIVVAGLLTMVPQYFLAYDRDYYGLFLAYVWPNVAVPIGYGLPILLCGLALLRGLGRAKKADAKAPASS